jgi:hypothetical protein
MKAEWFAGRLRELREARGLTQKEVAERTGLTTDGIAKLRNTGLTVMSLEEGKRLREVLRARGYHRVPAEDGHKVLFTPDFRRVVGERREGRFYIETAHVVDVDVDVAAHEGRVGYAARRDADRDPDANGLRQGDL